MPIVIERNVDSIFLIYAVCKFLSRIILKRLSPIKLESLRKVEKNVKNLIKLKADIKYLNFCSTNQLLPKFVNFNLYDVSAKNEPNTIKFKQQLLERELLKKKDLERSLLTETLRSLVNFKRLSSNIEFYSSIFFIQRISKQYSSDILLKHQSKLKQLYGSPVHLPEDIDSIINLSSHPLNSNEASLLNKGLNFGLKKRSKPLNNKIETEKLFYNLEQKQNSNIITIDEKEDLKIKLKNFAIRKSTDTSHDNLTSEERQAIKSLRENPDIVIQRPDKGGGVVVMNRSDYNDKLKTLISDSNKFEEIAVDQNKIIKKKINDIVKPYKGHQTLNYVYKQLHRVGEYPNGHLYGQPKIHKDSKNPPLRPIISMSGTVTHEIAQFLNKMIRPYVDNSHMLRSTDELLLHTKDLKLEPGEELVSLDVESLFTNVPVDETINIIIQKAYNHPNLPPPPLPEDELRSLLSICTQQTPFQFENRTFIQRDGVSMGSPLGPTFADFYMSHLECNLLSQDRISNPKFYYRYVDDILAIFKSKNHICHFIRRLKSNSVLNFTCEKMIDNKFNFLDVSMEFSPDGSMETGVHIKKTDTGLYCNYNSHTPENYKLSVAKSLIDRAIRNSSNWQNTISELERIRKILVNNSYPLFKIDRIIKNKIDSKFSSEPQDDKEIIKIFIQFFNVHSFKSDKKLLQRILDSHVRASQPDTVIKAVPYFKPFKISALFSTRSKPSQFNQSNVVYRYQCDRDSCSKSYIGYTTNSLANRIKQHRYKSSSIYQHFYHDHSMLPPNFDSIKNNFEVIFRSSDHLDLRIAEAIEIKSKNPFINVKYNELYDFLGLF